LCTFSCATSISIENPLQIRSVRRTVARLATELTKESCNNCNLPKDGRKRNLRKRIGVVTSDKMDKSIAEVRKIKHPYGKFVLKTKKYVAHETNDCNIGDL
jgi:hypothetical protein